MYTSAEPKNSSPNSRSGTPNSKIPVTAASSAKLRLSVLNRNLQTTYNANIVKSNPAVCRVMQRNPSGCGSGVPIPVIQVNQGETVSLKHNSKDRCCGSQHAFYQGFVEGAVCVLRDTFSDKLNNWVGRIQQEIFQDVGGYPQEGPSFSVHSRPTSATSNSESSGIQPLFETAKPFQYEAELRKHQNAGNGCGHNAIIPRCVTDGDIRNPPAACTICTQPIRTSSIVFLHSMPSTDSSYVYPDDKQCHGLEKLNCMASVFAQPTDGFFEFLSALCPKLLTASRYNIFHHETLPPVFTVTQMNNHWRNFCETKNHPTFILNHNDYSCGRLETDPCLRIECTGFFSNNSLFHVGKFLLPDSHGTLGSSEYFCANKFFPILIAKCTLTQESFYIRSRNYRPGYCDSDFLVYTYDDSGIIADEEAERSLVAIISRRIPKQHFGNNSSGVYPVQERLLVSFCGRVHPYTKAVLIATSFILKHDTFK